MSEENTALDNKKVPKKNVSWLKVFFGGLVLYITGIIALAATQNPNIFPTVIMLGNFLVPITYVTFFYQHRYLSKLDMPTTSLAFFYGGLLGILAAAMLEPIFIQRLDFVSSFKVGLIEEFAKVIGILIIAKRCRHDSEMDGLILGAASGMGFAALESTGYAFTAFLTSGGSLTATVLITFLRGLLSPVGHGTWTAILVSVMFRESKPRNFNINHKVVGFYLIVVILHGLWNGLPDVLSILMFPGLNIFIGQMMVGGIGILILAQRYKEAKSQQIEKMVSGDLDQPC